MAVANLNVVWRAVEFPDPAGDQVLLPARDTSAPGGLQATKPTFVG